MTAMRERRRRRVLRLRGVDMGFAVVENDKERVAESSYSDSRGERKCLGGGASEVKPEN
jgi:hypothetical protein